jgi:hypothetical protein
LLILLDLSEKINISCNSSFAYYSLNTITAVSLLIPLIRLVLQSVEKYMVRRRRRGTSRRRALNIYIFVLFLVILVFRLLAVGLRLIYRTNRYLLFIIYSLIAKRILAPSRVVFANSSPISLKRTSNKIVFQTSRTFFTTNAKIDSIILIYVLSLVFLVLIISLVFLYYKAGRILLAYYIFVLYKINRSMQIVIAFLSKKTKGLFFIYTRLRIY